MTIEAPLHLLFAYGTLRDTRQLDALVGAVSRWRVLADGAVQGRLYDAGNYPVLILSNDHADRVPGVLIELGDASVALSRLDDYENVDGGLYRRELLSVECGEGPPVTAWVYVYQRSVAGLRRIARWPQD